MAYQYRKLKGKIVEKFGSQAAFSEAFGISRTAMSNKMRCAAQFTQEDIEKAAQLLDIKRSEYSDYFFT